MRAMPSSSSRARETRRVLASHGPLCRLSPRPACFLRCPTDQGDSALRPGSAMQRWNILSSFPDSTDSGCARGTVPTCIVPLAELVALCMQALIGAATLAVSAEMPSLPPSLASTDFHSPVDIESTVTAGPLEEEPIARSLGGHGSTVASLPWRPGLLLSLYGC